MNVLNLLATVDPQAGGPTESVRQSGVKMSAMGHRVEVVSLDAPEAACVGEFPLRVHALGPARAGYRYAPRLVPWLREHAARFDAVIVNGLWQYHGFGAWQALHGTAVPYYVFPHGMLDPWFKREYPLKHLKKWLYWPWAEYRVLRDARAVLFTAEEERTLARESFWLYRANERVVSFGTETPPAASARLRDAFLASHPELAGKRIVLFLGRIHPKKGCDLLIRAFANAARRAPDAHLVFAGPDSVGWQQALVEEARALQIADRITWAGMLQGDPKWGAFHASDVFALPSHQENFGIAVAEALGCGVPVLISDKVNIWREVEADGAGLVAADTEAGTEANLVRWLTMDPADRERMRAQALATFDARFTIDAMARELVNVLQGDAANAPRAAAPRSPLTSSPK
jgi:glycosyltransferase involved in cell wall biosynthesis